jgi:tRNA(fMet)-specific endonuclease VapC
VRYVLDTNIVIAALNATEQVAGRLRGVPVADVGVPLIVLAELTYGACRSRRVHDNLGRVQQVGNTFAVVLPTRATADLYGSIRADLESRGLAKSDFDLLVACSALEHGAVLVTHDAALKDGSIAALAVEDWLDGGAEARP